MNEFARELVTICRAFGFFEREAVCCKTVTLPQCVALQALLDDELDVAGVAEALGVTPSAATHLVDGLEAKGWAQRGHAEGDRRRTVVTLTASGRREANRLRGLTEQAVGAVLDAIPANKRAQVLESMRLVRAAVARTRDRLSACGCCTPEPCKPRNADGVTRDGRSRARPAGAPSASTRR